MRDLPNLNKEHDDKLKRKNLKTIIEGLDIVRDYIVETDTPNENFYVASICEAKEELRKLIIRLR